jgi:hypothetical protein
MAANSEGPLRLKVCEQAPPALYKLSISFYGTCEAAITKHEHFLCLDFQFRDKWMQANIVLLDIRVIEAGK